MWLYMLISGFIVYVFIFVQWCQCFLFINLNNVLICSLIFLQGLVLKYMCVIILDIFKVFDVVELR